jgi:hypothetical protein
MKKSKSKKRQWFFNFYPHFFIQNNCSKIKDGYFEFENVYPKFEKMH